MTSKGDDKKADALEKFDSLLDKRQKGSSKDTEKRTKLARSSSTRQERPKEKESSSSKMKRAASSRKLGSFVDSNSGQTTRGHKAGGTGSLGDALPGVASTTTSGTRSSRRSKTSTKSPGDSGMGDNRSTHSRSDNRSTHSRSHGRSRSRSKSRRERGTSPSIDQVLDSPPRKPRHGESVSGGTTASSTGDGDKDDKGGEKRKTKLEKIEQLQAKNALYKEEFKRVQKDRKLLKKELETKKGEIEALTTVVDSHVASISSLKSQLSQALSSGGGGKGGEDNSYEKEIQRLQKENTKHQDELDHLSKKVQNHNRDLEALNSVIRDKDAEIAQLQEEAGMLRKEIRETELENKRLVSASAESADLVRQMSAIEEDRNRLDAELKDTVERATALVKEREDAIADLLKENEDFKNEIARRDNEKEMLLSRAKSQDDFNKHDEDDEQVMQLRMELASVSRQLEELQDRNVILEEEVEGWVTRGSQMEKEVARLQDELYQVQQTLDTTKAELKKAEERAEQAMEAAADADDALEEAEEEFRIIMTETAAKHKAALIEAKTKYLEQAAARADGPPSEADQQANLLKQAMKERRKPVDRNKSWFGFIDPVAKDSGGDGKQDNSDEALKAENLKLGKRLDELEDLVEEQEEEIKALKSELVQVRTTFNDTLYKNKKQMERLEHENHTYAARVAELESQLQIQRLKTAGNDDESNSSLSSHS